MSADDKIFAGSIPGNYDRQMVPLIFESYAPVSYTHLTLPTIYSV